MTHNSVSETVVRGWVYVVLKCGDHWGSTVSARADREKQKCARLHSNRAFLTCQKFNDQSPIDCFVK